MFSLRDLRFVFYSLDFLTYYSLDVLRAQRIIGFLIVVEKSDHVVCCMTRMITGKGQLYDSDKLNMDSHEKSSDNNNKQKYKTIPTPLQG